MLVYFIQSVVKRSGRVARYQAERQAGAIFDSLRAGEFYFSVRFKKGGGFSSQKTFLFDPHGVAVVK